MKFSTFIFLIYLCSCSNSKDNIKKIKTSYTYRHSINSGIISKDGYIDQICIYNNEGLKIEEKNYKLNSIKSDTILDYKVLFKYAKNGSLIEEGRYDVNGTLVHKKIIEYNNKNKPIFIRIYFGKDIFDTTKLVLIAKMKCTYNKHGEIIEKEFNGAINYKNEEQDFQNSDFNFENRYKAIYIYNKIGKIDSIKISNLSLKLNPDKFSTILNLPNGIDSKPKNKIVQTDINLKNYKYLLLHPEDTISNYLYYKSTEIHKYIYDKNDSLIKINTCELKEYDTGVKNCIKKQTTYYLFKDFKIKKIETDTLITTRYWGSNGKIFKEVKFDKVKNEKISTIYLKYDEYFNIIYFNEYDFLNEPKEQFSIKYEYW